jgi:hypothetical protein
MQYFPGTHTTINICVNQEKEEKKGCSQLHQETIGIKNRDYTQLEDVAVTAPRLDHVTTNRWQKVHSSVQVDDERVSLFSFSHL